ncbi:MAG: hypothetical protein ACLFV4_06260 [Candidatus Hydrogenedentota bacterium]
MYRYLVVAVLAAPLLAGCVAWEKEAAEMRADNIARMESYTDEAVINGVLSERTVYPYYFYHDTPHLTELGQRNLSILGAYYKNYPGPLNIRQRGTSGELYEARVAEVREHLAQWGVAIEEVEVRDEFPGGDGAPSSRVYEMVEADDELTVSTGMDVQ